MDIAGHCMSRESNIPLSNPLRKQNITIYSRDQETATENKPVNTSVVLLLAAALMSWIVLVVSCRSPVMTAIGTQLRFWLHDGKGNNAGVDVDQKKCTTAAPKKELNCAFESLWKKQAAYWNKDIWSSKKHGPDSSKCALGQPQAVLKPRDGCAACQKPGQLYLPWVNCLTCPLPTSDLI